MTYYRRHIDAELLAWRDDPQHKPLLIRGARQVGKSSAVRELGRHFRHFVEVNLEKDPTIAALFTDDVNVRQLCTRLSAVLARPIVAGQTLLFLDEVQVSPQAIKSLRYFREDYPELHVIAAGSLLEFTLEELPSFAVGRIRSLYLYPFSFDEFLMAQGLQGQLEQKAQADARHPLPEALHRPLVDQLRAFLLVGGMPAAVSQWVATHDYLRCLRENADIIDTYQDDFAKYKRRVSPDLLRQVLRSVALQAGRKFVFAHALPEVRSTVVREALRLLALAGLVVPVRHTDANGLPLGAEADPSCVKYLPIDTGLMLSLLSLPASDVLLATDAELVNRGALAEVFAGLEMQKYSDPYRRPELYYWQHNSRGGNAEVDYLSVLAGRIVPVEVKSGTRGGMQSLYFFMRRKQLTHAIRTSLEPFGHLTCPDPDGGGQSREVDIIPLYALSNRFSASF